MPSLSCRFNVELKWCNNTASLSKFDGAGDEVTRSTFLQRHSASISHSADSLLYTTQ